MKYYTAKPKSKKHPYQTLTFIRILRFLFYQKKYAKYMRASGTQAD